MPDSAITFTGNGSYLRGAMSGLAAPQRAIANNVANVDTPNFKASEVRFEDALKSAIGSGTPGNPLVAPPATPATAPVAASGRLLPVDLTSPNFLAQFKAALKTIASVFAPPQLTQRPPTDPRAALLMSPATDEQPEAKAEQQAAGDMPDMLAELGFAVVPPAFP